MKTLRKFKNEIAKWISENVIWGSRSPFRV